MTTHNRRLYLARIAAPSSELQKRFLTYAPQKNIIVFNGFADWFFDQS
jgi:hypothetical protein